MARTSNIVIIILSEDSSIKERLFERFPFLKSVTVTNPEPFQGIYRVSVVCSDFEKYEADIRAMLSSLMMEMGPSSVSWYKC